MFIGQPNYVIVILINQNINVTYKEMSYFNYLVLLKVLYYGCAFISSPW